MRNFLAGLSAGSGAVAAAIVVAALIAAGFWVQSQRDAQDVTEEVAVVAPAAQKETPARKPAPDVTQEENAATPIEPAETPEVTEAPSEEGSTAADAPQQADAVTDERSATPSETAPIPAPAFDEVRREADGVTVIAGKGAPGAEVQILQDGTVVARATADRSGKFATIALIPPDGQGHVLTLLQMVDGQEVASEDEIILAPMAAPVTIAEASPEPTPETETPTVTAQSAETETVASAAATLKTTEQEDVSVAQETAATGTVQEPATESDAQVAAAVSETPAAPAQPTSEVVQSDDASTTEEPGIEVAAATQPAPEPEPEPEPEPTQTTAGVAILKSTADGVELLNAPTPEVMDNVAIDTISYSDAGAVQLAGRAQTNATTIRVYLDNRSVISLPVDDKGRWRGDLPDVDEGVYTLRVDEVAADGQVTSRVETPFKREAPATLAAAAAQQDGPIKAITVQKGATLWAIARDRYGDGQLYVRVFEANRQSIRDPDLIYPGQIFDLPD